MFTKSLEEIKARYERMSQLGEERPTLVAAECNLYPFLRTYPKPKGPGPYPYLNSGGWIGPAGSLRGLLLDMIVGPLHRGAAGDFRSHDQGLFQRAYASTAWGKKLVLDSNAVVFQSLQDSHQSVSGTNRTCRGLEAIRTMDGDFVNTQTWVSPAVLHFHGVAKNM
jgi:hypothetical protein